MPLSLQSFIRGLPELSGGTHWVAFSGGLDSSVLLQLLADAREHLGLQGRLKAIHINHQISPNAGDWENHAQQICNVLSIPLVIERVVVLNQGAGIEDAARAARYAAFESHLQFNDTLHMAHHADDQAETLLLRLLRGTGNKGLAGMPRQRPLGRGYLVRPLLYETREALEHYARDKGLTWVDDESNFADNYDRNFLRNQIFPLLKQRWPQAAERFQEATEKVANQQVFVDQQAQTLLNNLLRKGEWGQYLPLDGFLGLSKFEQNMAIRAWVEQRGLELPEAKHLDQLNVQLGCLKPDSELRIDWGKASLRLSQGNLYLLALASEVATQEELSFTLNGEDLLLALGEGAKLEFIYTEEPGIYKLFAKGEVDVGYREAGDRCKPLGRQHSQTLKRLFQELGIPQWLRDQLPVIRQGDQILAVGGLFICQGFETQGKGYKIIYTPPQAFH